MEHLERMKDLTHRYASARLGAAGLGSLWAFTLMTVLLVLIWNHINAEFAANGAAYSGPWSFLGSDTFAIPAWIKSAGLAASMLTWIGIAVFQFIIDRGFGAAIYRDPTNKLMRLVVPIVFIGFLTCVIGYNTGKTLAVYDNNCESAALATKALCTQSIFELMNFSSYMWWAMITAWAVIWAFTTRDSTSRAIACLQALMLYPIVSSNFNQLSFVFVLFQFVLLAVLMLRGLRQFATFLKVRNEINALPVIE